MAHPLPEAPLKDLLFVGFDTETTGLSPLACKLVELSAVKFRADGSVTATFSQLINPEASIPAEVTAIHGITDSMVAGQPTYRQVVPEFASWLESENTVLIAHNASFDLGFLEVAFARLRLPVPDYPVLDTLGLCRRFVRDVPNHQLKTLSEHLGLGSGGYHRALADSFHVKELLIHLLSIIAQCNTWEQLANVSGVLQFNNLWTPTFTGTEKVPDGFELVNDAIATNRPLKLVYRNEHILKRIVTPRSVHTWRGNLYLSAFCHTAQSERTYRLDKIISLRMAETQATHS